MAVNVSPETEKERREFLQYIERNEINSSKFILLGLLIIFLNVVMGFFLPRSINGGAVALIYLCTLVLPLFIIHFRYRRCPRCGRPYGIQMPVICPQCKIRLKRHELDNW